MKSHCKNLVSRLPWNQETVFGWVGMMVVLMFGCATYMFLNTLFTLLFVSICTVHKAFYLNAKRLVEKLDELINVDSIKPSDHSKIATILCEIMKNGHKGKE